MRPFIALAALLAFGAVATAHHSPVAVFDMDKRVTQKGTFKAVHWTNPHVNFDVEVLKDGKPMTWQFESHGVSYFTRNGIRLRDFQAKIGLGVEVLAQPAINGNPFGFVRVMKFADGTEFKMFED